MISVISQNLEPKPRKRKSAPKINSKVKNLTSHKINVISKKVVLKKKIASKSAKAALSKKRAIASQPTSSFITATTEHKAKKTRKTVNAKQNKAKKLTQTSKLPKKLIETLIVEAIPSPVSESNQESPIEIETHEQENIEIKPEIVADDLSRVSEISQQEPIAVPLLLEENPVVASGYFEPVPSPIIATSIQITPITPAEAPEHTEHHENHTQTAVIEKVAVASIPESELEEKIVYSEPVESIFADLEQILAKDPVPAPAPVIIKTHIIVRIARGFLAIFTKFAKRMPQ
jgi:hypothetical protein